MFCGSITDSGLNGKNRSFPSASLESPACMLTLSRHRPISASSLPPSPSILQVPFLVFPPKAMLVNLSKASRLRTYPRKKQF